MRTTMCGQIGILIGIRQSILTLWMSVLMTFPASFCRAQLAITEAMAYASLIPGQTSPRPDFWELTNFGDKPVSLDGYGFHDRDSPARIWEPFAGVTIGAGESILICRTNRFLPDTSAFVAWWGAGNLRTNVQVQAYTMPGFDDTIGDEIWLWDALGNLVDKVSFGPSIRGRTKTYDPASGIFDRDSEPGVGGAFRAALAAEDIGSPGWTTGPVPIYVLRQPASQTIDCCGPVEFSVEAGGIPRPTYQWTSNNVPIPGATWPVLTLPAVAADSGGAFRVILSSASVQATSAPALLIVNTTPTPPRFVLPIDDADIFPGQSVTLSAPIRGYPIPHYLWFSNGVALAGAVNSGFTVATTATTPPSSAEYTLILSNQHGRAESSARVTVMRRPMLQITEVMPDPTNSTALPPPGLKPWFEVTNNDTNAVNLKGYRFKDNTNMAAAYVIRSNPILQPGESMIFVDTMSREAFFTWWGDDRLLPGLQVVTWFGWSLDSRGNDIIHLWNAHAVDPADLVANATYLSPCSGVSQETLNSYDDTFGSTGYYRQDSAVGVNGAFSSSIAANTGSPGFTSDPDPFITRITRDAAGVHLRCRFVSGRSYRLFSRDRLDTASTWTPVQTIAATNIVMTLHLPLPAVVTRFYRLEELP